MWMARCVTGSMNASSFKYEKKALPCFTCKDEDTYLRALPSDKPEDQWMRPMDNVKFEKFGKTEAKVEKGGIIKRKVEKGGIKGAKVDKFGIRGQNGKIVA